MANDKINKARDFIDEGKYAQARKLLKGLKDPKAKRLMDEIDDLAPVQSGSGAKDALHVILMGLIFTVLFGGIGYVVASSIGIPKSGTAVVESTPGSAAPTQSGDVTQAPQSVVIEPTLPPPPTDIPCEAQAWWDANNATAGKLIGGALDLTIQTSGQQIQANKQAFDAWLSSVQSEPVAACMAAVQQAIVTAGPQVSALYDQFLTTSTEQTRAQALVKAMDVLLPATDEIGKLGVSVGTAADAWIKSVQDFSRAECTAKRWYNEIILGKDYKRFFTLLDALDVTQIGAATNSLREMQGLVGSFQADSATFPACVKTASDALVGAMTAFVSGSNARLQNDAASADAQLKAANTGLANFYSELGKLDASLASVRLK